MEDGMATESIKVEWRVWYDAKSRRIKLAGPGVKAYAVSDVPGSERYHPILYRRLAKFLRDAGVAAPALEKIDADKRD
jgi:hypothetical protein